jgi:fructuronate reductase
LTSLGELPADLRKPACEPADHAPGIVHIGVGAFRKAYQAVYTDDALASEGGDWRIVGVSLRSPKAAEDLNLHNGLYSLLERALKNLSAGYRKHG